MNSKSIVITIAIILVVSGGAFYGGMVYKNSSLVKQNLLRGADSQRRGTGQGAGQGMGMNRGGGQNGNQGDFVNGDIMSKDDKSITVKTRDGGSKIIYFSDSTTIGKAVSGTSSDLATGQQVMVSGKSSPDGSLAAQSIQIRPDQQNQ